MTELSVIIPTYNRREMLRACLTSLSSQTQSSDDYEVLVVDDGSTDGTAEMLATFSAPYSLHVIRQPNSGQAAALNRGIDAASAEFCLFLDDDIIAGPELVAEHLRAQREHAGMIGIGHLSLTIAPIAGGFVRGFAQWWETHYTRLRNRTPSFADCFSGNLSAPRAALRAAGGFATDLIRGYDIELGYRLEQQGLKTIYLSRATGSQDYRKGFRQVTTDAEREGIGSVELYRRHPPMLPPLHLGGFHEARLVTTLVRRLLLALRVPIFPLQLIDRVMKRSMWASRWYHLIHGYCYWRGVRRTLDDPDTWHRLTSGTRILMYHAIGLDGEPASRYILPRRRFVRQMMWLKWMGYHVLSLEEYLRYRQDYRLPPARSVILTFDDGYADNRTEAFPILLRFRFPATVFLVSQVLGATNQWDTESELAGRPLLSRAAIREMLRGGLRFGAHTRTHAPLSAVSTLQLSDEVKGSKSDIEQEFGRPALAFAYPYGEYDGAVLTAVEEAGFSGACGITSGLNSPATPNLLLRRAEIYGTDSLVSFALTVCFGRNPRRRWRREQTAPANKRVSVSARARG